eukprot:jgi/Ulvmu1/2554/UM014_0004.1
MLVGVRSAVVNYSHLCPRPAPSSGHATEESVPAAHYGDQHYTPRSSAAHDCRPGANMVKDCSSLLRPADLVPTPPVVNQPKPASHNKETSSPSQKAMVMVRQGAKRHRNTQ